MSLCEKKNRKQKTRKQTKTPQINLESLKIPCKINEKIPHLKHHSVTVEQIHLKNNKFLKRNRDFLKSSQNKQ